MWVLILCSWWAYSLMPSTCMWLCSRHETIVCLLAAASLFQFAVSFMKVLMNHVNRQWDLRVFPTQLPDIFSSAFFVTQDTNMSPSIIRAMEKNVPWDINSIVIPPGNKVIPERWVRLLNHVLAVCNEYVYSQTSAYQCRLNDKVLLKVLTQDITTREITLI